ncbi:NAD(P)-binding protein [Aspergillus steynii IBT 23096]|uniref:NAD(P)-binding protein n=1 Tax=Aspergillus steynii IBT 23096 TaxID=1392250 RepID=A0A2I2GKY7_9EURO|nr:NAD(P)-binding protein [Aspergillus steynii IBT 23096]PLB53546.1 NAD(P)-binding protein [Aspergillus steynii IBT 23096]
MTEQKVPDPSILRPQRSLAGRVAIVTGAGAAGDGIGNGRAAAILLAEDDCAVVCVDIQLSLAEYTVQMITDERNGTAIAVQADVTVAADCQRVVQTAIDHFGRVDILFNCVGVSGASGTAESVDMEAWTQGLHLNISSMVMMVKYVVPEMRRNEATPGYRGSIVNMGSVAGLKGGTPHLLYPTSKGAIVNMTRAMAAHHARDGIRVNCVCPGMVYTPMMYAKGMSDEARQARKNRSLLKTEGNGWDVGAAVRFLASDQARWMTGVILPVDGGTTAAVGTELPASASVNG